MFEIGVDLRPRQLLRDHEVAVLAGDAAGVPAELIDLADDLLVDRARENHLDDLDGGGVGHAQAAGEFALDVEPLEEFRDLRAAAMHNHGLHACLFEHHDVPREAFRELRVAHGMAAIFDDNGRLIVALHVGQRLGEDFGGDAWPSQAFVEVFVRIGVGHSPSRSSLSAPFRITAKR